VSESPDAGAQPNGELDLALLDRFLAGECSAAEAERVRRWLAGWPLEGRYLDAIRDALERRNSLLGGGLDTNTAWTRLARDTVNAERNADRVPPPLRLTSQVFEPRRGIRRVLASPWLRAAVLVAAIGAGLLLIDWTPTAPPSAVGAAPPRIREYATVRGQRSEFRLRDGTRVMLAPDSRLGGPADFAVAARELTLQGQAYFDVTHDERKPFTVRAGNALARDLGTRFVVRAYPGAHAVQVVVAEGKVQLGSVDRPADGRPILVRGDVGRLDTAGVVATARTNVSAALAWTRGELVFVDTPLSEIAVELGRWYDLDIRVDGAALKQKRLTMRIGNDPAPVALDAVGLLVGARYEIRGQSVSFSSSSISH